MIYVIGFIWFALSIGAAFHIAKVIRYEDK